MSDKIGVRDRRNGNKYYIDNCVYDTPMSCECIAFYNGLARYSNAEDEQAFFSGKKFKRHHGIGHAKYEAARKEAIALKLVRATGEKTDQGAEYYELLNIDHLILARCPDAEQGGVLAQTRGGVPRQNRNKPNKTSGKNNTAKAGGEATESLNSQLTKACEYILKSTGCTLKDDDKWIRIWWYRAAKSDGIDNLKIAIKNFCNNKANKDLGQWDWISFFKIQAKRANYLPKIIEFIQPQNPVEANPYAFLSGKSDAEIVEFLTNAMSQGAVWTQEIEKYRGQVEANLKALSQSLAV